jgi:hypothetical protein
MLKKAFYLSAIILIMVFQIAEAQVTVKLKQPPPNQLRATDIWNVSLTNTTRSSIVVILSGTLEESGAGIIVDGTSRSFTLKPGTKIITYDDVKSGSVNFKSGKWREAFTRTGNAPSGDYTICIYVKNESEEELGTDCVYQTVEISGPPELISPADGEEITPGALPTFTWLPPMPTPPGANYKIKIVEIIGNQSPEEAMLKNKAFFEKEDIRMTMFQYPLSAKKIESNKSFAWQVFAVEKRSILSSSEIWKFSTDTTSGNLKSIIITSNDSTTTPNDSTAFVGGTGTAVVGDTIRAGLNGEFKVIVFQLTTEADSSLTGKGKVYINWLKTNVAVEFKKIRIDSTKRLTSGGIVTSESGSSNTSYQAYPKAWALSLLSGPGIANAVDFSVNWTNNQIDNLVSWTNGLNFGQPQINYQSNIPPPPIPDNSLKMPFGLQFNNGNDLLVITEIIFKQNVSKINFLAQTKFTKSGTQYKLGFAGKYFEIHPSSIDFSNGRVELVEDIAVPNLSSNPKMKFIFKKGTDTTGCYIQWENSGITDIGLGLEVKFTRDWLIPFPTSTDTVKAKISGNGTSMQDILLTGILDSCEIVGTNGMKIQSSSISLDLSDVRNNSNMVFPVNYPGTTGITWQGFYVKNFSLTLPDNWRTGSNLLPPSISATDVIIDDMGITTKIKAINVFNLQSGKLLDLSASLDTIEVSIVNSSLVSGTAKGLVVLPISKDSIANSLRYTATFAQANNGNSFQVAIVPYQAIEADILKGKMTLKSTSNITATKSSNVITLAIKLNGTFGWDNPNLSAPVLNAPSTTPTRSNGIKGVKMELGFENLGLTYTNNSSSNTNTATFNLGTWSFASPQKLLANFPVSIKNIRYKSLSTVTPSDPAWKELLRGALMMDIVANLTDDIGGTTTVGAAFAVEFNKSAKKFNPKFKGVFIDSIAVHANLSAVKIDGTLKFYDNDPMYGDGFSATLGVTFTAVSLQLNALVQFGNTAYQNNNQLYRYWRAEADVILPVGIPFLTGVGFYGFGGGAFYNMEANPVQRTAPEVGSKYVFTPKKSSLGFMVKATIGTLPKFETFNADVSLLAQFNQTTRGLETIAFTGDFWLTAKLTDRPASKIKGGVLVSYNFPDKLFSMLADLSINVTAPNGSNIISTIPGKPIGFVMKIDGRSNKWYFKFGVPQTPNTVKVFPIELYSYLMFGNDIPIPTGFTPKFVAGYTTAIGQPPSVSGGFGTGGVGDDTKTGKGIATGVGMDFNQLYNKNLLNGICRNWSIAANLNVGAELNLAIMDQIGCEGINGYRASGNIGLYFNLTSTINGTSKSKVCSNKSYNLFKIQFGAWLKGEFPNPTYVAGAVYGKITAFEDLVNVPFDEFFIYGTQCAGTAVIAINAAQEDKAADLKNKLIEYVAPNTQFNFPITETVNVKYALVPNQVFDVAENQGDGTVKNRTFKLIVTPVLEVKNSSGAWVSVALLSKANNIGEYQYFVKAPLSVGVIKAVSQSGLQTFNKINTNNGNMFISPNGSLQMAYLVSPLPPPPAPNYPNPVPSPVNTLVADMDYRFTVKAELKEGVISGNTIIWSTAKTRNNLTVVETKTKHFRTGSMPLVQVTKTTPKVK